MGPVAEGDYLVGGIVSSYTFLEVPWGIVTSSCMKVNVIELI